MTTSSNFVPTSSRTMFVTSSRGGSFKSPRTRLNKEARSNCPRTRFGEEVQQSFVKGAP